MALSRWDASGLAVTVSDDGSEWAQATTLDLSPRPWELVQVGKLRVAAGNTRGLACPDPRVGPMRTYALGAILLDLDDPCRVLATLPSPLLVATKTNARICAKCSLLLRGAPPR